METLAEQIQTIESEAEYDLLMAEMIVIFDRLAARTSADEERLNYLVAVIKEYEDRTYHFDTPDAVDMILFRLDQMGLKRKDLIPMIGSRARVSEVLNRKRPLTVKMIKALHEGLHIAYKHLMPQE